MLLQSLNFSEAYKNGDLEICLPIGSCAEKPDGELVIRVVPTMRVELDQAPGDLGANERCLTPGAESDSMFGGVCQLAESAEIVTASGVSVPSGVWLEGAKNRVQDPWVSWLSFSLRNAGDSGVQVVGMGTERKVEIVDLVGAEGDPNSGTSGVVQGMFDVPEGVTGELAKLIRNGGYAKLREFVAGLRIVLTEESVGAAFNEPLAGGVQVFGVFACPTEQRPCT
jgi:hypothetical protein